ncbi:T9SS type A sorting domain-containing protein [Hanstruepera marina]|uniref:T9SS type A sorting domain-containing protein n=1 Tax=Hanstruepera marina TaxID=2873265 RepID=UPI001CA73BD8|nr:T9SS type A sorting domain-containing protein [Hanstruepera marina]
MKRIILLVFVFLSFYSFSQNPELDDNTWYLQNVVIDCDDHLAPVNEEISEVTLDFFIAPFDFHSNMCNSLTADIEFNDANSTFMLSNIFQTFATCGLAENSIYEQMYFNLYSSNQANPLTYNISTNSDSSTLVVTASNGDQAIYGSARLHAKEFRMADLKTYPNPIIDELFIENQNNDNLNISVYNINGQLIHSESVSHEQSVINVSELKSGIYFFVFEGGNFKKEIRKIIKQ